MKVAIVFPGQGAQHLGMGAKLFQQFPEFTRISDSILGYSIEGLCTQSSERQLAQTQYTQPALYVVSCLYWLAYQEESQPSVDFFAGHSLGEYAALFAGGAFDFKTGLELVKRRGELMSSMQDGGMAAVSGCSQQQVETILKQPNCQFLDLAGINSPQQMVIAGPLEAIKQAKSLFEQHGAKYTPLNVGGAFHSRLMKTAAREFGRYLSNFSFSTPSTPVIANVSAKPHSGQLMPDQLTTQLTQPVKWVQSVEFMLAQKVDKIIELGPRKILTALNAQIKQSFTMPIPSILNQADTDTPKVSKSTFLGSEDFQARYNLIYPYYSGAMYKAIASKEMVVRMGRAGMLGIYGSGGMRLNDIEDALMYINQHLSAGQSYGMNLLCNLNEPDKELQIVDLYLKHGVRIVEASAYMQVTPALIKYRLSGLRIVNSRIEVNHRIIAKVSRQEIARVFLLPPPQKIVQDLLSSGQISEQQAQAAAHVPMADDLCVESDSGGHTDMGNLSVLLPSIAQLRNEICAQQKYASSVGIGAAGGIGSPEAAAVAFMLGADFVVTGSINQCTVEAGISDEVKEMLQSMSVNDTAYAPAGDMFELGAKVQVLKRGVFFPARANKLYELWKYFPSWDAIDEKTRKEIEGKYFRKTFNDVYEETKSYYFTNAPLELERAEKDPKHKLALVFKWYFIHSTRLALAGDISQKVDFQIHCSPACGAFNHWVKGSEIESWRNRHVDDIGIRLMQATETILIKNAQKTLSGSRFSGTSAQT